MQYCRIPCSTAEFCQLCSFPTISTDGGGGKETLSTPPPSVTRI